MDDFDRAVARIHRREFGVFLMRRALVAIALLVAGVALWMAFA
jgi:hypothetical protein